MKKNTSQKSKKNVEPEIPHNSPHWLLYAAGSALLILVAFALYYKTLSYDFQFDDLPNITKYFAIRYNTFASLFFSRTRWLIFWLNSLLFYFFRLQPFWYRLLDLIIHSVNAVFVFSLLTFCLQRVKAHQKIAAVCIPFFTALLFIIHPVQSQTVCYIIQGQLEGLAALSILMLIACLCMYATTKKKMLRFATFILAVCIAVFATGTKEITIVAPALLLLWDWFFLAQRSWPALRLRIGFHAIVAGAIFSSFFVLLNPEFFVTALGLSMTVANNPGNVLTQNPTVLITPFYWLLSQAKVLVHYLIIFVWPVSLSVEYDGTLVASLFSLDFLLPAILLLLCATIIFLLLRRENTRIMGFGLLWFFVSMAPRTSIVPCAELCADYKTYVGSIGLFLFFASALVLALQKLSDWMHRENFTLLISASGVGAFSVLLCAITVHRQTVWSSGLVFWHDVVAKAPHKARAFSNYGAELSRLGRHAQAIDAFERAIELDPFYSDPLSNSAVCYMAVDNLEKAIEVLEKSIRLNPQFPEAHNNLAIIYQKKGDIKKAESLFLTAVQLNNHYGKAWHNLGMLYVENKEMEKAYDCFKICCYDADFDDDQGFHSFAKACVALKRYDDAIAGYQKLLSMQPENQQAVFHLANVYTLAKKYDAAIGCYQKLLEAHARDPRIVINLGQAYWEKGDPVQALYYFKQLDAHKNHFPSLYIHMARCYKAMGDTGAVQGLLKELYTLNPAPVLQDQARELMPTIA